MSSLHYHIHLEPDLEQFCFRSVTAVHISEANLIEGNTVVLNARDLEIEQCTVDGATAAFVLDEERQTLAITLPSAFSGEMVIRLVSNGRINNQYAGLYRSRYTWQGQEKWLASTQFQASDARRVFPCFDHPAHKATFDVELLVDKGLTAVSNTAVYSETSQSHGKKLVRFEQTPPMSTYLLFMAIGEFEAIQTDEETYQVRVLTTAGKREYGRFALKVGRESLQFCEEYTGLAYPLSKCDLIAVPDSIGAMENFGAIRHSEDVLLVYPHETPQSTAVLIAQIIAHEVSHMWFGNLVTPASWKYLWLNESFATYFTFVIPDALFPEWRIWEDFAIDRMRPALDRDALPATIPVELPPGQAPTTDPAPTPSSAPIVYSKGAAVLRMLAAYCGEETFKQSVHHYLQMNQFDSVTSQQFWDAIAAGARMDVRAFADAWVHQPGYPLLTTERIGRTLHIRQQRFTLLAPSHSAAQWPIPIDLLTIRQDGELHVTRILLESRETTITLPMETAVYKLNHKQTGFYRVRYDAASLAALGHAIAARQLNAIDSFNVQNDLFAGVRRSDMPLADYLSYVETYFARETRYLPLLDILQNLTQLYSLPAEWRPEIGRIGRAFCEDALQLIGLAPQGRQHHQDVRLQQALLWAAGLFGSQEVRQFGYAQFDAWQRGTAVSADILPTILKLGALTHPHALPILTDRLQNNDLPAAESLFILDALGQLPQPDLLQTALAFNWQHTPRSRCLQMINAAAQNPFATDFLWDWLVQQQEKLATLHPGQVGGLLVTLIPVSGLGRETAVSTFCQAWTDEHPSQQDTLTMALEWLEINGRLCKNALDSRFTLQANPQNSPTRETQ